MKSTPVVSLVSHAVSLAVFVSAVSFPIGCSSYQTADEVSLESTSSGLRLWGPHCQTGDGTEVKVAGDEVTLVDVPGSDYAMLGPFPVPECNTKWMAELVAADFATTDSIEVELETLNEQATYSLPWRAHLDVVGFDAALAGEGELALADDRFSFACLDGCNAYGRASVEDEWTMIGSVEGEGPTATLSVTANSFTLFSVDFKASTTVSGTGPLCGEDSSGCVGTVTIETIDDPDVNGL